MRASLLYTSLHPSNEAFLRSWPATSQLLLVALVAAALIDQLGLGGWPLCPPQTCNVYFLTPTADGDLANSCYPSIFLDPPLAQPHSYATPMLALGPCVMAMHVARLPLKMQAYPSSAVRSSAVRVQPPSCVEAYMEFPSEDYYQTSGRPLDDIQPLRSDYFMVRPARRRLLLRGLRPVVFLVVVLLERLAQLGAHLTRRRPGFPQGLWSQGPDDIQPRAGSTTP